MVASFQKSKHKNMMHPNRKGHRGQKKYSPSIYIQRRNAPTNFMQMTVWSQVTPPHAMKMQQRSRVKKHSWWIYYGRDREAFQSFVRQTLTALTAQLSAQFWAGVLRPHIPTAHFCCCSYRAQKVLARFQFYLANHGSWAKF